MAPSDAEPCFCPPARKLYFQLYFQSWPPCVVFLQHGSNDFLKSSRGPPRNAVIYVHWAGAKKKNSLSSNYALAQIYGFTSPTPCQSHHAISSSYKALHALITKISMKDNSRNKISSHQGWVQLSKYRAMGNTLIYLKWPPVTSQ